MEIPLNPKESKTFQRTRPIINGVKIEKTDSYPKELEGSWSRQYTDRTNQIWGQVTTQYYAQTMPEN